jgi:elongation factor Ts
MGKCRSALVEEGGDAEKAIEWLRQRGVKSMERRSAESAEALLALSVGSSAAAITELKCETDYVTRAAIFQELSVSVAATAVQNGCTNAGVGTGGDDDPLLGVALSVCPQAREQQLLEKQGAGVGPALLELGSVLGERLVLGRSWRLEPRQTSSILAGYVHPKFSDGIAGTGRMAALVSVRASPSPTDPQKAERLQTVATQLARHVVAAQPQFVDVTSVPEEVIAKEKESIRSAHLAQMDPKKVEKLSDEVLGKVVDGKTNKFYGDTVLLKQELVGSQADASAPPSVEQWLRAEAEAIGAESLTVEDFRLAIL